MTSQTATADSRSMHASNLSAVTQLLFKQLAASDSGLVHPLMPMNSVVINLLRHEVTSCWLAKVWQFTSVELPSRMSSQRLMVIRPKALIIFSAYYHVH